MHRHLPIVLVIVLLGCSGSTSPTGKKWYEGGTLHKKGALDWQVADYNDKLATCDDIVATAWQQKKLKPKIQEAISSVDDMKPFAQELVTCLDAATKQDPDPTQNRK